MTTTTYLDAEQVHDFTGHKDGEREWASVCVCGWARRGFLSEGHAYGIWFDHKKAEEV